MIPRVKVRRKMAEAFTMWIFPCLSAICPNGKDTVHFVTQDASGSTSQAAGVAEAVEAQTKLLLIDEDTSATNFYDS